MNDEVRYVKPGEIDIFHRWYDNRKENEPCYRGLQEILDNTIGITNGLENILSVDLYKNNTKNGTMYEYISIYAGGDWEDPFKFIIYMGEDEELYAYVPKYGSGGDGIHGCAWSMAGEHLLLSKEEKEYDRNCEEHEDYDIVTQFYYDSIDGNLFQQCIDHTLTVRGDEVREMPPIPDEYMAIHNKLMNAVYPWWDSYQKDLQQKA